MHTIHFHFGRDLHSFAHLDEVQGVRHCQVGGSSDRNENHSVFSTPSLLHHLTIQSCEKDWLQQILMCAVGSKHGIGWDTFPP